MVGAAASTGCPQRVIEDAVPYNGGNVPFRSCRGQGPRCSVPAAVDIWIRAVEYAFIDRSSKCHQQGWEVPPYGVERWCGRRADAGIGLYVKFSFRA